MTLAYARTTVSSLASLFLRSPSLPTLLVLDAVLPIFHHFFLGPSPLSPPLPSYILLGDPAFHSEGDNGPPARCILPSSYCPDLGDSGDAVVENDDIGDETIGAE